MTMHNLSETTEKNKVPEKQLKTTSKNKSLAESKSLIEDNFIKHQGLQNCQDISGHSQPKSC